MKVFDKNRRPLWVTRFLYEETYGGLIQGKPNKRLNTDIVKNDMGRPTGWPDRPHLILTQYEVVPDILPLAKYHAWLTSDSIRPQFMDSDLMITWLADEDPLQSIEHLIQDAIKTIIWEDWAGDFDY